MRSLKLGLTTILLLVSMFSLAQDYINQPAADSIKASQEKKFDWNKVYTGGGLGLQFGNFTFIDISPVFGYRFSPRISAGIGLTYKFFQDNRFKDYKTHIYGGSVFGKYAFTKNFFGHLEYELLNLNFFVLDASGNILSKERRDISYLWVGGGYRQPVGDNSFFLLTILYNILDTPGSFYPNPIYRLGVNIGL